MMSTVCILYQQNDSITRLQYITKNDVKYGLKFNYDLPIDFVNVQKFLSNPLLVLSDNEIKGKR